MSFASTQNLSPTYKNLTITNQTTLGTTTISGPLTMSSGMNINANNSAINTAFLTCGLDTTIERNLIFNSDGSSSIYNTFALQGGTTMNASNSTILVKQLNVSENGSINMGSSTNITGFANIEVGTLEVSQNGSIIMGSFSNIDMSAENAQINGSFSLQGGTTMNASNSTILVKQLNIDQCSIESNSGASDLFFSLPAGAGFYFNQPVYTNTSAAVVADVGLLTSVTPTHPSDKSHIGFVLKEHVVNPISVVTNVSSNILSFTLPKGTFLINAILQLDVPNATNFTSAVVTQSYDSSTDSFTSTQLVPNDSPNDITVNIPIFNTVFNSSDEMFTLSLLAQYTSASYINVTANSYLIATRIA
jgi:hypothetical protein